MITQASPAWPSPDGWRPETAAPTAPARAIYAPRVGATLDGPGLGPLAGRRAGRDLRRVDARRRRPGAVTGDYARIDGELGPWAGLVEAVGLDAESTPMKIVFVVYGCAQLAAAAGYAAATAVGTPGGGRDRGRLALVPRARHRVRRRPARRCSSPGRVPSPCMHGRLRRPAERCGASGWRALTGRVVRRRRRDRRARRWPATRLGSPDRRPTARSRRVTARPLARPTDPPADGACHDHRAAAGLRLDRRRGRHERRAGRGPRTATPSGAVVAWCADGTATYVARPGVIDRGERGGRRARSARAIESRSPRPGTAASRCPRSSSR